MRSEYKIVILFYFLFSFHSLFILCYKKSFKRINFHLSRSKKKTHNKNRRLNKFDILCVKKLGESNLIPPLSLSLSLSLFAFKDE